MTVRVLLVEDHAAVSEISIQILGEVLKYEVEHATSGSGALELAGRIVPDVVLVDLGLPDMNGYDLALELRADVQLEQVKLVALTGHGHARRAKARDGSRLQRIQGETRRPRILSVARQVVAGDMTGTERAPGGRRSRARSPR